MLLLENMARREVACGGEGGGARLGDPSKSKTCMVRMRAEASLSLTYPRPYSSRSSWETRILVSNQIKSVREPTSMEPIHKESHPGRWKRG